MRPINPTNPENDHLIVGETVDGFSILEFAGTWRKGRIDISEEEAIEIIRIMNGILESRNKQTISERL